MKAVLASALLLISVSAFASNKHLESTRMTCAAVQHTIAQAGSAIVHTGPGLYDRYVAHGGFCSTGESTEAAWIPTRDTNTCLVYVCRTNTGGGDSAD